MAEAKQDNAPVQESGIVLETATQEHIQERLSLILDNAPQSWHGTTYPNDSRYVGRQAFIAEMLSLLKSSTPIEESHLAKWFPEDYVRLGSPFSTLLEVTKGLALGFAPQNVFCFASSTLPFIAVMLSCKSKKIYLYGPDGGLSLISEEKEALLQSYGCTFERGTGEPQCHEDGVVLQLFPEGANKASVGPNVDAALDLNGFLYIVNAAAILPEDVVAEDGSRAEGIHTLRKRLGAPIPTPDAICLLRGQPLQEAPDTAALQQHLKELGGCGDAGGEVALATTGLAALGVCVMGCLEVGGGALELLMCSTAYGGSSQQADILCSRASASAAATVSLRKHTFDIQGAAGDVLQALSTKLSAMAEAHGADTALAGLTLIQLEYPTNPDMKDCALAPLADLLATYTAATGSQVVLLLDNTFCPPSQAAAPLAGSGVPVIVFTSLSKSVSGGFTTGGSLVANSCELAQQVLAASHTHLSLLDTSSKGSQLSILCARHGECEARVADAHAHCVRAAAALEAAVEAASGTAMLVNFVSDAQVAKGVTPATFSFNLPPPANLPAEGAAAVLAGLAQAFVDELVTAYPTGVKPCVSFGQQNSLVYATVPATSTQGVISDADKDKQAVGGVQLVRFSFPPIMVAEEWDAAIHAALATIYGAQPAEAEAEAAAAAATE